MRPSSGATGRTGWRSRDSRSSERSGASSPAADHVDVFSVLSPGIDVDAERAARRAAGRRSTVTAYDLYPDAVPCLTALIAAGYLVGVAANQPESTESVIRELGVDLALVASSERWGVSKPDAAFFERLASELQLAPETIAYVGDPLDNDIAPAARAGMTAIFIRRGPWAVLQAAVTDPRTVGAAAVIESLDELPGLLRAWRA